MQQHQKNTAQLGLIVKLLPNLLAFATLLKCQHKLDILNFTKIKFTAGLLHEITLDYTSALNKMHMGAY